MWNNAVITDKALWILGEEDNEKVGIMIHDPRENQ